MGTLHDPNAENGLTLAPPAMQLAMPNDYAAPAPIKFEMAPPEGSSVTPQAEGSLSFTRLRLANAVRHDEWWDGTEGPSLSFRGNELAGEVGEALEQAANVIFMAAAAGKACNIFKKLDRERIGMRGSRATKEQAAEELADVIICADLIAMDLDIDLGAAVAAKFNATSEKYGLRTRIVSAPMPTVKT